MTKIEFESIISQKNNLSNLPNAVLLTHLDKLSTEFETTKQTIINTTYHLDKVEEMYNIVLNEYQKRINE